MIICKVKFNQIFNKLYSFYNSIDTFSSSEMDYTEEQTSFSFLSNQDINFVNEQNYTEDEENESNQKNTSNNNDILDSVYENSENNLLDFTYEDSENDIIPYNYEYDSELDENSNDEGNFNITI